MLGKLLKTLKSEKSSKGVMKDQISIQDKAKAFQFSINDYKMNEKAIENEEKSVEGKIKKIRYYVLSDLPSIFNQVLSCPISTFHHLPHGQRKVKEIDLNVNQMPHYLQFLIPVLKKEIPTYNHILINDYPAGIGIMPHSDGPSYHPKVLVLSLNSYCIINFQQSYNSLEEKASFNARILLQPNSIHIFEQEAYTEYLHGIQNYAIDCILLKYDEEKRWVTNVNIDNYHLLACKEKIEKEISKGEVENEIGNGEIRIIRLDGNEEYSHKIQIQRKERISITIREKYQ